MSARAAMSGLCWLAAVGVFVAVLTAPDGLIEVLREVAVFGLFCGAAICGAGFILSAVFHSPRSGWPK